MCEGQQKIGGTLLKRRCALMDGAGKNAQPELADAALDARLSSAPLRENCIVGRITSPGFVKVARWLT